MDAATIILTALTTGAAAAAQSTVETVVKDAYTGFKELVKKHFSKVPVQEIEDAPDDEDAQNYVKKKLQKAFPDVSEDVITEVLEKAQEVLKVVEEKAPETAQAVGIDLEDVKTGASINIKDLDLKGIGLNINMKKVETEKDITITGIKVDNTNPN